MTNEQILVNIHLPKKLIETIFKEKKSIKKYKALTFTTFIVAAWSNYKRIKQDEEIYKMSLRLNKLENIAKE